MVIDQISYRAGYKYQLAKTYTIQIPIYGVAIDTEYLDLSPRGALRIKTGYAWDGPSGITIDTDTFMRGSLVHDALYQLIREGHLPRSAKEIADKLLRKICLDDKMCRPRAWYVYHSVHLFAGFAVDPKNRRKLKIAPKIKPVMMRF